MNAVSAQLRKEQSTAGAAVRVIFISSCPSAQEQGEKPLCSGRGSRRWKVRVLVREAQLSCLHNTPSWSNGRAQAIIFPFETREIETRSQKKGTHIPFSKRCIPGEREAYTILLFLISKKLVRVEDCHQSCFYAPFCRLAVMKHGMLVLQSIQIAFVTSEFFIQFFKQEVTSECIELMWIHLNFMSFALAYRQRRWAEETVLQVQPLCAFGYVISQTDLKHYFVCC